MDNQPASPLPPDDPVMIAWSAYKATRAFKEGRDWALQIAPSVQAGSPDADQRRRFEIMPLEERDRHLQWALFGAFMAGYTAGRQQLPTQATPVVGTPA